MGGSPQLNNLARVESGRPPSLPATGTRSGERVPPDALAGGARILFSEPSIDPLDGIPEKIAARAIATAEIIAAFRAFKGKSCRTLEATGESFIALYNCGQIETVSVGAREFYPSISWPSLKRDWRKFEKHGIAGVIRGYGKRRGDSIIARNPSMRDFCISNIKHNARVRAPWLLQGIEVRFPNDQIPSLGAVQKFIRDWKRENASLFLKLSDPDAWKSRHMLALGDAEANITRVGQRFEIDGTKSDAFVRTEVETKTGKFQMLGVIDVFDRKIVAHLAPSESSQAVADLLIKAFPIIGMPDEIVSDCGKAFLSARTQRAMARLGVKWTAVRAYSGEKKPFVERGAMGTVLHSFFENLPGYSGHSPAEASAIRKRNSFAQRRGQDMVKLYRVELTAPELQKLLDDWLAHVYGNKKHSKLGRTPNEVFSEADRRGQVRRVADDRLLDLLLSEDGVAVIGKKGLRAGNSFYWDDALVEHVGQTVQYVRTRDAGKLIVYTADSAPRLICIAVDPEALGLDREVLAIAAKQRQAAVIREGMEDLRALTKKHRPHTVYREIIENAVARDAARLSEPEQDAGVVSLPYRSPALEAAAAALDALEMPSMPAPHDEETLREGTEALNDIEARREIREMQLDDDELDALWMAIRREPRVLTLREQRYLAHFHHEPESWADNYETTDEFRALKMRLSA